MDETPISGITRKQKIYIPVGHALMYRNILTLGHINHQLRAEFISQVLMGICQDQPIAFASVGVIQRVREITPNFALRMIRQLTPSYLLLSL
jgi:hypothetical protein